NMGNMRRPCMVCGVMNWQSKMRTFTSNAVTREQWIRAVRHTVEERSELRERLKNAAYPFLCETHFPPECFNETLTTRTLKKGACPRYPDPTSMPIGLDAVKLEDSAGKDPNYGPNQPGPSSQKRIKVEEEEEIDGSNHMENLMNFVEDCEKAVKYEDE
ncbi:hypothetical protein PFISCL1PPCAC_21557, partial [Pristionchus fissidentatus]